IHCLFCSSVFSSFVFFFFFFFQAEDGIRDRNVTGVQTCALPISALQADRLPQMGDDRQPREPGLLGPVVDGEGRGTGSGGRLGGGIGRLWILWSGHQYLTRGSMKAARTSTMKFVIATMTARNTTIPCTATKSRAVRYSASLKPSPCHPKVVSVSTAPASMRAICMPM